VVRLSMSKLPVMDERDGIRRGPKIVRYPIPAMASGMPTGASSNMVIGRSPSSRRVPFTSKLVEVPMSVQQPPRIEQYDSGINNREAAMSLVRAKPSVTGRRIATMAVLFIHALKNAASNEKARMATRMLPDKRSLSMSPM